MPKSSKSNKNEAALKYNLSEKIEAMPKSVKVGRIVQHLNEYGISKSQFYRDKKIPLDSTKSISHDRLTIYAKVFECEVDSLANQLPGVNKVKSIRHVLK